MNLSSTAHVILGLLSWGPKSGYEIKALVDRSTRFFWAASYGQIYPELRKLADAGLIEGAEPEGGRRRTVYRLTAAGQEALDAWLAEDPEIFESRDEGLLKLFFADSGRAGSARRALEAKRRYHAETTRRLLQIQEEEGEGDSSSRLVLRYGIECHQLLTDLCARALAELPGTDQDSKEGG